MESQTRLDCLGKTLAVCQQCGEYAECFGTQNRITELEWKIIDLVCKGRMNKQIAEELGNSENTIKNHMSEIFIKSGIQNRNRVSLAVWALNRKNV